MQEINLILSVHRLECDCSCPSMERVEEIEVGEIPNPAEPYFSEIVFRHAMIETAEKCVEG